MKSKYTIIASLIIFLSLAGICAAEFSVFAFPKNETVVFENYSPNSKPAKVVSTYYASGSYYVLKTTEENGNVIKITVDKNFKPLSYKKVNKIGAMLEYAGYGKGKLNISIPSKRLNKTVDLPSTYYDPYTLFYAFRKFPFGKKDSIQINLAYHDPGNIRVVKMGIKYKGIETVKTKAGSFKCYKLEMGTINPMEVAVWPYKYYFWFTTDSNHHFVKFSGREKDASTITSEIAIYKIGSKYVVKKSSMDPTQSNITAGL